MVVPSFTSKGIRMELKVNKYKKKPVVIEAVRFDKSNNPKDVAKWCGGEVGSFYDNTNTGLKFLLSKAPCELSTVTIL